MNYLHHYNLLISRAQNRTRPEGYTERHHIIPRCLGGNNTAKNLVYLTAREHFVAHQLLVKTHPDNTQLIAAAYLMSNGGGSNGKKYEWLKIRVVPILSINGRQSVEKGLGVHSQTKEQLSVIGKQTVGNRLGFHAQTREQLSTLGKISGTQSMMRGVGIHARTREQRSVSGRVGGKINGKINGAWAVERKSGIHAQTIEQRREFGRHSMTPEQRYELGRVVSAQRWQCQQCSMITSPGSLGIHQKSTGHAGRVKLS